MKRGLALRSADAVLVRDGLNALPAVIALSRRAHRIAKANLAIAGAFIAVLVRWGVFGHLPLPLGVAGHEGPTVIVGLNGVRLLTAGAWHRLGPKADPGTGTAVALREPGFPSRQAFSGRARVGVTPPARQLPGSAEGGRVDVPPLHTADETAGNAVGHAADLNGDQVDRRRFPVGTAMTGVPTRHPPLRDSHRDLLRCGSVIWSVRPRDRSRAMARVRPGLAHVRPILGAF